MKVEVGDQFTIAGVLLQVPSGRRWWQFWRPRWVTTAEAQVFTVTSVGETHQLPGHLRGRIANDLG